MEAILEAQARDTFGKNEARRTRRGGKVPGVLYGAVVSGQVDRTATAIAVDPKALLRILHSGANTLIYPSLGGGTNFQAPSYSAATGYVYLEYSEGGGQVASAPAEYERGKQYIGRDQGRGAPPARGPNDPVNSSGIKALDPETGRTVWDVKTFQGSLTNGLMATAGNVVLASIRDGNIAAFDAVTGKALWHFQTGAGTAASPMSYAVDGRQFVAVAAGNFLYGFALPKAPQ